MICELIRSSKKNASQGHLPCIKLGINEACLRKGERLGSFLPGDVNCVLCYRLLGKNLQKYITNAAQEPVENGELGLKMCKHNVLAS